MTRLIGVAMTARMPSHRNAAGLRAARSAASRPRSSCGPPASGEIDPYVAGPTAIGVFLGATVGSRLSHRVGLRYLRWLFVVVMLYTASQMLLRGIT